MEYLLVDPLVVEVKNIRVKVLVIELTNVLEGWVLNAVMTLQDVLDSALKHSQGCEAQKVILDVTHWLQVANILSLRPRRLTNRLRRDKRHTTVKVLANNNTTSVARARTNLTIESINVIGYIRILSQEALK